MERVSKDYGMAQIKALLSVVYTDLLKEPVPYNGVKVIIDRQSTDDKPGIIAVSIRTPSTQKTYPTSEAIEEVKNWMTNKTEPTVELFTYNWNGDYRMEISCNSAEVLKNIQDQINNVYKKYEIGNNPMLKHGS